MKVTKKPVEHDAIHYSDNIAEVNAFCGYNVVLKREGALVIAHANRIAHPGDWLVKLDAEFITVYTDEEFQRNFNPPDRYARED